MSDDPPKRDRSDRAHININEEREVRYWTSELGISEERLREVVARVGTSPGKVRQYLLGS